MQPTTQVESVPRQAGGYLAITDLKRGHPPFVRSAVAICLSVLIICGIVFVRTVLAFDEEIARLTRLLEQEPNRVDLLKQRALLFRLEARLSEALSDLDRARSLAPNDREVRLQRGLTLSGLRREQEAETELNVFLEMETGRQQVFALTERGRIRARTGRPALGIADLTAAIAIQPALDLYLARGQLQESLGQLRDAAGGYQSGLGRLGRASLLTAALIRVQIAQGQFQSALAVINQELARATVKTPWLLRRAEVLAASGQAAQAQLELEAALTEANRVLEKRVTGIHLLSRAKVLIAMGRLNDASSDLQGCVGLAPGFIECRELLNKL